MPSLSPASFLSPQPPLDLSSLRDMQLGASNQPRPVSKSMLPSNAADIVGCRQEHRSPSRPKFAALVAFCNPWYETRESGSGTNTENKTQQQNQPFRSFFLFGRRRRPANSKIRIPYSHRVGVIIKTADGFDAARQLGRPRPLPIGSHRQSPMTMCAEYPGRRHASGVSPAMEHFLLQVVKKKQRVSDSSSSALLHGPRRSSDAASDVRWCGAWFGAPLLDNGVH
ncbi:hypothetical protein ACCO45_004669 [Purpureocillium lilacinum]|uniref:Uncharacterized protein n=1 Tax=Purpureocillium lilacinum TaxID=33203 RepID=A0ACC4DUE0_PURLI